MESDPSRTASEITSSIPILLIVDDEQVVRDVCTHIATGAGLHACTASNTEDAVRILERTPVDLVVTDLRIPQVGGMELVRRVRAEHPDVGVVVLTQFGTIETTVEAMRLGAADCLSKPFRAEDFERKVEPLARSGRQQRIQRSNQRRLGAPAGRPSRIVGESAAIQNISTLIERIAPYECPVLILGETGTGKELSARAIHDAGARSKGPFVAVDCLSLTPTLIEAELFGYRRGAFTGATESKIGLFEAARGGTLFLDEIGDLARDLQAKLLRVLQDKQVRPIGAIESKHADVRVIAATNRDLETAVKDGSFRQDLYYRLNVVQLHLPPLRDRKTDIPALVSAFLEKHSDIRRPVGGVCPAVWEKLYSYYWPGNIRELENVVVRALALGSDPFLQVEDLQFSNLPGSKGDQKVLMPLGQLDVLEKNAILNTIEVFGGDRLAAARFLGIGKTTLYRKLKSYRALDCHENRFQSRPE